MVSDQSAGEAPGEDAPGAGTPVLIRPCTDGDFDAVWAIINAAATVYEGAIPADRYHVPYMPADELRDEIAAGVCFWGWYEAVPPQGTSQGVPPAGPRAGRLIGVMGIQDVDDVTLIRHAYVLPERQRGGLGGRLLAHLLTLAADRPGRALLVGTWADAWWAIAFYERHGFALVGRRETDRLLRRYWAIAERQVETSVVLTMSS